MKNKHYLNNLQHVALFALMAGLMVGCRAETEPDVGLMAVSAPAESAPTTNPNPNSPVDADELIMTEIAISRTPPLKIQETPKPETPPPTEVPTEPSTEEAGELTPLFATAEEAAAYFQNQGYFVAGVRNDAPPLGELVNEQLVGFDIDLVHEFAHRWLGNADAVRLVVVPASRRIEVLVNREVDLLAAAMTYTSERCAAVICSRTYTADGARLLVRKDSGITNICDLDGKFVTVLNGTSAIHNIQEVVPRWCNFERPPQVVIYEHRADAIQAVVDGTMAAYTTDGLILEQFAQQNDALIVVGDEFSPEPYHMAVPPEQQGIVELINLTLEEMKADGTYNALFEKWFGCRVAPFPIQARAQERPFFVQREVELTPSLCSDRTANDVDTAYIIQPKDTLGGIAARHYGYFDLYPCIQQENEIADADLKLLRPGTQITLPAVSRCSGFLDGA